MANGTPAAVQQLVAACLAASWLLEPSEVSVMIRFAGRIHLALLPHAVLSQRLAGLVVAGTGALTGSVVYTLRSPLVGLSMTRCVYKTTQICLQNKSQGAGLLDPLCLRTPRGDHQTLAKLQVLHHRKEKQGCRSYLT